MAARGLFRQHAAIGREVEDAKHVIADLYEKMARTQAISPTGVAVQLRRVQALIECNSGPSEKRARECAALLSGAMAGRRQGERPRTPTVLT